MAKTCPHCQNTIGFDFGTCCRCGWNHLTNRFSFIEVWLEDVPDIDPHLIAKHAARTAVRPAEEREL